MSEIVTKSRRQYDNRGKVEKKRQIVKMREMTHFLEGREGFIKTEWTLGFEQNWHTATGME